MAAALAAGMVAWPGTARAAGPQADPMAPPAFSSANGNWAYQNVHPADGDTFTATPGTWSGLGNTYAYQWQRCTAAASGCTDVPGATSPTLVARSLYGGYLRVAVTATNSEGSATAYSAATAQPLADEIPTLTDASDPVSIAGTPEEGSTLSIDPEPHYTGSAPLTSAATWERCAGPASNQACTALPGAGGRNASYVLQPADVGKYIRVTFDVFNALGHSNFQFTGRIGPVRLNSSPPVADAIPVLTGPFVEGVAAQGNTGAWHGARPMTFALQWLRCDGDACADLPGETTSRHTPTAQDLGHTLRLRVTATNANGLATSISAPSDPVAPAPPAATAPPQASGTPRDGQILAGQRGTWSGSAPIAETAAWERCNAAGDACSTVAGGDAYTLVPADVGHRMRFKVTAENAGGSASARSAATAVVQAIAPAASELPVVSGEARDEQVLAGTLGAWSGSPEIAYARQWLRCVTADPADCSPIAGATGAEYPVGATDVGARLRLRVTASNFGNAVAALSQATAIVAASAPHAEASPSVSGEPRDGETLAASPGEWKGTGPLAMDYRWERCAGTCAAIPGATGATYALTAADVGARVRVVVTATGPGGTAAAPSAATDPVTAIPPASPAPVVTPPPPSPAPAEPAAAALPAAPVAEPGGEASLALPAGSLLTACQVVSKRSLAAGGARLSVPAGISSSASPLVATVTAGRAVKRVALSVGGRAVRVKKGKAALKPAVLARAQLVQLTVTRKTGRPVKASARLVTKPCEALLSARMRGTRLTLRVDQRTPVARVAFTLPSGLALKLAGGRAGTIEALPFGGGSKTVFPARPGKELALAGRTVTLGGLPPRTAAVTLTVDLAGKGRRGRALRFTATVTDAAGVARRLTGTVSVRR